MPGKGYAKKVKGATDKIQTSLIVSNELHQQFRKAAAFAGYSTVSRWMRAVLGASAKETLANTRKDK